jgi:4a-hydroxytetrahydrobiopterin dehydratase
MPSLLSAEDLAAALTTLDGWDGGKAGIHRSVTAKSFAGGIHLVDEVAKVADEMNHHPDIDIRWRTVHFRLSTHSMGGVTDIDIELARRIDALVTTL